MPRRGSLNFLIRVLEYKQFGESPNCICACACGVLRRGGLVTPDTCVCVEVCHKCVRAYVCMYMCVCVCVCVCVRVGGSLAERSKLALSGLSVLTCVF